MFLSCALRGDPQLWITNVMGPRPPTLIEMEPELRMRTLKIKSLGPSSDNRTREKGMPEFLSREILAIAWRDYFPLRN